VVWLRSRLRDHGGELPGFKPFMGYDPDNEVALVIWTNLTLSPHGKATTK
jgi:D-alanyl-D-alanine carboxypeptidase